MARCVTGVATFHSWRLTGSLCWQQPPALEASILAKVFLLLFTIAGPAEKKQNLKKPSLRGGTMLTMGFLPSYSGVHSHACGCHLCPCSKDVVLSHVFFLGWEVSLKRSLSTC